MIKKVARSLHRRLDNIFDEGGIEMTFRVKNSLITMAALLVAILILIGVIYHSTKIIINKTVSNNQITYASQAAATTGVWAEQQIKILVSAKNSLAKDPEKNIKSTINVLKMAMAAGEFSDVYIGLNSGKIIDGADWTPPAGYDTRTRPWYVRAVKNGMIGFTKPYIDLTTMQIVIALSVPLTDGHSVKGVLSADIVLDKLMNSVVNNKNTGGFTFIIGPAGTIMLHPDKNILLKQNIQDIDPSLSNIMDYMLPRDSGSYTYQANGKDMIMAFKKVDRVGWYLCTAMSMKEAYEQTGRTTILLATESVLKVLGLLVIITMMGVGGSAILLLIYNRRFNNTMQKQQVQIIGMNEDLKWNITKRKDLETHYHTLFNVANDAIMVCKGFVFVDCNEKANEIFGIGHYGIIGNSILDFSPDEQPDGISSHNKALELISEAEKGDQQFFTWNFKRHDGTEFPAEVSLKKLKLNNEFLILLSIRDISKRVNAELQLRQAQKMATMGEMVGAIAHQWRQPLNILSTYIASLQSAFYNNMINKDFVEKVVAGSDSQIQFMSKTIDDFRHFFKPSKNKEPFDAVDAVETAVRLTIPNYKQNGVELGMNKPDEKLPMTVTGCRSEFVHVVVNLLANARDSVTERAQKENDEECLKVFIEIEQDSERVIIRVRDCGGKIPEHLKDKIFNPYFTTKTATSGTGIGLYMSKTIVENEMGGQLFADNYDNGAVFTIVLPKTAREDSIVRS